jgi:hypothetical protein
LIDHDGRLRPARAGGVVVVATDALEDGDCHGLARLGVRGAALPGLARAAFAVDGTGSGFVTGDDAIVEVSDSVLQAPRLEDRVAIGKLWRQSARSGSRYGRRRCQVLCHRPSRRASQELAK